MELAAPWQMLGSSFGPELAACSKYLTLAGLPSTHLPGKTRLPQQTLCAFFLGPLGTGTSHGSWR